LKPGPGFPAAGIFPSGAGPVYRAFNDGREVINFGAVAALLSAGLYFPGK